MKPVWWTCGCGKGQMSLGFGRPKCQACGKDAQFTLNRPTGQRGFDFGSGGACGGTALRGDEMPDR